MTSTGLRFEDRLDGFDNFSPWKERITILFKELELWDIVGASDTIKVPTYVVLKTAFDKKDIKAHNLFGLYKRSCDTSHHR